VPGVTVSGGDLGQPPERQSYGFVRKEGNRTPGPRGQSESHPQCSKTSQLCPTALLNAPGPPASLGDLARQAEAGAICRLPRYQRSRVEREIRAMPPSGAEFLDHDFMLKPEAWANRKHEDAARICDAAT